MTYGFSTTRFYFSKNAPNAESLARVDRLQLLEKYLCPFSRPSPCTHTYRSGTLTTLRAISVQKSLSSLNSLRTMDFRTVRHTTSNCSVTIVLGVKNLSPVVERNSLTRYGPLFCAFAPREINIRHTQKLLHLPHVLTGNRPIIQSTSFATHARNHSRMDSLLLGTASTSPDCIFFA